MVDAIAGAPTKEGNVQLLQELLAYPPAVVVNGDSHTTTTLDGMGALDGVSIGDIVTGSGVVTSPPTTVVAVSETAHTVTLSQATSTTVANTDFTFTPVPSPLPTTLHLFKDTLSPTLDTTEADFEAEECDFSGYAAVDLDYGSPGLDSGGNGVSFATRVEFQNSTGVVGNSVGGAWLSVDAVPGVSPTVKSIRYFKFLVPIPMSVALATLGAVVVLNTPQLNGKMIFDN